MNQRLQQAAESGSINDLYALIDENPCILENIDAMPFVNTPLHIAASCGEIQTGAVRCTLLWRRINKSSSPGCSGLIPALLALKAEKASRCSIS
ncbi:BnaC05g10780D [Brassica napus]|uniref:BnaC05g10780D protein n=2 Tax=Brassica TaxID=3705 RepID=A0A078HNY0_BRANA|nr:hypothetical protein Bca52824_062823 [Brassica carinata]CDY39301.1 BnaC05g10780D [Brassica napus]